MATKRGNGNGSISPYLDDCDASEGIHYDRIVLAVIPYVQALAGRVAALQVSSAS